MNTKETYWSQFSGDFEAKQSFVAGTDVISKTLEELKKEQNLGQLLELGCGTGLYTEELVNEAQHITATDFSDEMIEAAIQMRGNLNNVNFQKADAMNLQFENESFDTVFMANLIHIIEDPEKVLKESYRVLKPNGLMIITSFAVDQMSFFNKISLANRFIKTFGKPPKESSKVNTSKKNLERLITKNAFDLLNSKILGKKEKAIYLKCVKKTSN